MPGLGWVSQQRWIKHVDIKHVWAKITFWVRFPNRPFKFPKAPTQQLLRVLLAEVKINENYGPGTVEELGQLIPVIKISISSKESKV